MKNLKVLFAGMVLVISFFACSTDHDDITPDQNKQTLEKFDVKSDEEGTKGLPGGED